MFKAIAIGLMASPLALGGASANRLQPSIKRAVYNDSTYSITLSVSDLSNPLSNLSAFIAEEQASSFTSTTLVYNDENYTFDDGAFSQGLLAYFDGNQSTSTMIQYNFNSQQSSFVPQLNYWGIGVDENPSLLEYDLVWNVGSALYEGIKTALQLDIQSSEESMPSIADIFNEVTSAITSFVGSLGNAFTQVTSLFYASGEWTFLGVLVLIGVGVGLFYGAYRIIKGLLHRV